MSDAAPMWMVLCLFNLWMLLHNAIEVVIGGPMPGYRIQRAVLALVFVLALAISGLYLFAATRS